MFFRLNNFRGRKTISPFSNVLAFDLSSLIFFFFFFLRLELRARRVRCFEDERKTGRLEARLHWTALRLTALEGRSHVRYAARGSPYVQCVQPLPPSGDLIERQDSNAHWKRNISFLRFFHFSSLTTQQVLGNVALAQQSTLTAMTRFPCKISDHFQEAVVLRFFSHFAQDGDRET